MKIPKKTEVKSLAAKVMMSAFGEERVRKRLLQRNFGLYHKTGAVFIHVPKVAGTTISTALYGKTLGHFSASDLSEHNSVTFNDLFVFAFLRDPIERAQSSFNYARSGGTEHGMIAYRKEYSGEMFSDFEIFATEWLPAQQPETLDFVFQPQSDFLLDKEGELLTDKLYRLDSIQSSWIDICKNSSPVDPQLTSRNVNKKQSSTDESISSVARLALEKYYRKDFELWNSLS